MNLILIGMMGSGKTTVGKLLSEALALRFLDTDAIIEEMQGLTISRIFEVYGEKHFRNLEAELVEKLSSLDGVIISTGGGLVLNPWSTILLKKMGTIIYLSGSSEQLAINLAGDEENRPLLKENRIDVLLKVRDPIYKNAADLIVEIDGNKPSEVMQTILDKINA